MKEWSLFLGLALLTITTSLLAPSQAALLVLTATRDYPSPLWQVTAYIAYELTLWGSGLSVWIIGRRLGWLSPFKHKTGFLLCVLPLLGELSMTLAFGHLPAALTGSISFLVRIACGVACYLITRQLWIRNTTY